MQHLELDRQFHLYQTFYISPSREEDSYYHEYCRLYLANVVLTSQVKQLIQDKNQLVSRLHKLEDDEGLSEEDRNNQKNKRFRRTAHQIERYYKCVIKSCEKSYGSQGSLNQHYKLKHPQIYVMLPSVQQVGQIHFQLKLENSISLVKTECSQVNENENENIVNLKRRKTSK